MLIAVRTGDFPEDAVRPSWEFQASGQIAFLLFSGETLSLVVTASVGGSSNNSPYYQHSISIKPPLNFKLRPKILINIFVYGVPFVMWNSCGVGQSDRIERVQNYAMRIILRKPPRTNSDSLRQALSWTTLKARRHNAMLSQVHRCVKGQAPFYLSSKFTLNSSFGYNGARC